MTVHRTTFDPVLIPCIGEAPAGGCFFEKASGAVWIKAADGQWLGVTKFRVASQSPTYDAGNFARFARLTQFKEKHFI